MKDLIRHYLATLAYRFQKAVRGAPLEFADFDAGSGVRTPRELIRHMTHVLRYLQSEFEAGESTKPDPLAWQGEITRFHNILEKLDANLADSKTDLQKAVFQKWLQGPLSDVMTHIGQIAMLRRLAGFPVEGESFRAADIQTGRVGPDQPNPRKIFNA